MTRPRADLAQEIGLQVTAPFLEVCRRCSQALQRRGLQERATRRPMNHH